MRKVYSNLAMALHPQNMHQHAHAALAATDAGLLQIAGSPPSHLTQEGRNLCYIATSIPALWESRASRHLSNIGVSRQSMGRKTGSGRGAPSAGSWAARPPSRRRSAAAWRPSSPAGGARSARAPRCRRSPARTAQTPATLQPACAYHLCIVSQALRSIRPGCDSPKGNAGMNILHGDAQRAQPACSRRQSAMQRAKPRVPATISNTEVVPGTLARPWALGGDKRGGRMVSGAAIHPKFCRVPCALGGRSAAASSRPWGCRARQAETPYLGFWPAPCALGGGRSSGAWRGSQRQAPGIANGPHVAGERRHGRVAL